MPDHEIVELRVMGPPRGVDQLVADLQGWCDIRRISPPHANRGEDGGVRRYVTVLVPIREGEHVG